MSVKIRLKRFGTKMRPFYRIVVMDSRVPRDGVCLAEIGLYHPIEKAVEKQIVIDETQAKEWLAKGARPTDTVRGLFNKKGIQIKS